jgi:hypothetical protein
MTPRMVTAQATTGVGDDAIPIPAHGARIRIGGLWTDRESKYVTAADGSTKRTPLLEGLSRASLGVADLPTLAPAQTAIRDLSGLGSAFTLSLGKLEARGDITRSIVPFSLAYGISKRLSLSVLVPYVETRSNNKFVLNRGGAGATVGENPARSATGTARTTNGAVLSQIAASRTSLAAEIARCADVAANGGGCDAIRANTAAAQTLLAQASMISTQLASLYGTAAAAGAPMIPIQKSAAQAAIDARITGLRTSFESFASSRMTAGTLPVGATLVYGSAGFQGIAKDSAFGLAYDSLANGGRAGIGDVDVMATVLLFDGFGASQSQRLLAPRRTMRSTMSVGFRFGTATGGRSGSPFDVPTGDGADALLLRSTTDLILNRHFWVSGTVRLTKPMADQVVTRFPALNDSTLFLPSVQAPASRAIGSRTEIEVAPRVAVGTFFGFSMAYAVGHQQASTLAAVKGAPVLRGTTLTMPSSTVQAMQFGASYSTLNAFVRGHSRWPIEVLYSHGITVNGTGGAPAETFDRVEMRIYTRFPRR